MLPNASLNPVTHTKLTGRNVQRVDRAVIGLHRVALPDLDRIDAEVASEIEAAVEAALVDVAEFDNA